jgi:hypothetical protein
VPEPSDFEIEISIEKLKRHRSPSTDQFPAELINERGRIFHSEMQRLINSIWNKEEYPEEWKE